MADMSMATFERLLQLVEPLFEQLAIDAGIRAHRVVLVVALAPHTKGSDEADQPAHGAPARRPGSPSTGHRRAALARQRREVCKTQECLAAEVGVLRSTVARWESGHTMPSLWVRPRLANALHVPLSELDELLAVDMRPGRVADHVRPLHGVVAA